MTRSKEEVREVSIATLKKMLESGKMTQAEFDEKRSSLEFRR